MYVCTLHHQNNLIHIVPYYNYMIDLELHSSYGGSLHLQLSVVLVFITLASDCSNKSIEKLNRKEMLSVEQILNRCVWYKVRRFNTVPAYFDKMRAELGHLNHCAVSRVVPF